MLITHQRTANMNVRRIPIILKNRGICKVTQTLSCAHINCPHYGDKKCNRRGAWRPCTRIPAQNLLQSHNSKLWYPQTKLLLLPPVNHTPPNHDTVNRRKQISTQYPYSWPVLVQSIPMSHYQNPQKRKSLGENSQKVWAGKVCIKTTPLSNPGCASITWNIDLMWTYIWEVLPLQNKTQNWLEVLCTIVTTANCDIDRCTSLKVNTWNVTHLITDTRHSLEGI